MKSQIDRNNVWGRGRGGGVVFKNAIFIAFSSVSRQFLSVSRQIKIKTEGEMSELTSRQILAALMVKTKPGHTRAVFGLLFTDGAPLMLSYSRMATKGQISLKLKMS